MMGSCGAMGRGGAMTICCGAMTGHVGREGHMERVHRRLDQSSCVCLSPTAQRRPQSPQLQLRRRQARVLAAVLARLHRLHLTAALPAVCRQCMRASLPVLVLARGPWFEK